MNLTDRSITFNSCCSCSHQHVLCLFYTFHRLLALLRLISLYLLPLRKSKNPSGIEAMILTSTYTFFLHLSPGKCFRTHVHAPPTLCTDQKYFSFDKQRWSIRTCTGPQHCTQGGLLQPVNPSKIHHCQRQLVKRLQFIMITLFCH